MTRARFKRPVARYCCCKTRRSLPISVLAPKLSASRRTSTAARTRKGRYGHHTLCGILMHSSLAVTTDGLPLGLTAVKFGTRNKFKERRRSSGNQSDASSHREEGKRAVVGKCAAIDWSSRQT